jgi:hypothetical protein
MFEPRLRHRCLCALLDLFRCSHLIDGNVSGTTLHGVIAKKLHNIACERLKLVVMFGDGGTSRRVATRRHRVDSAHTQCMRPSEQAA